MINQMIYCRTRYDKRYVYCISIIRLNETTQDIVGPYTVILIDTDNVPNSCVSHFNGRLNMALPRKFHSTIKIKKVKYKIHEI